MQLPKAIAISTLVSAVVLATGAGVMMGSGSVEPASVAPSAPTARVESAGATAFNIDKTRSMVIYKVRDLGVTNYYGRINAPTGTFTLDRDNPENSSVVVNIDMKQMDSGDKNRDRLLLGPQYFNARQYPTATFESTSITKVNDTTFQATGSFTMRGVTKEITVTLVDYAELQTTKFGYRGGFEATFTINRLDYGLTEHEDGAMLGLDVQITISVMGLKQ